MTDSPKTGTIRRIAVAIDCSPHSLASLKAAAEIAGMLRAELIGIFVEDINLLRIAELPCTREIRHFTATTEKIEAGQLERLLRLQAREAKEKLQRIADEFMIRHTFRVSRGLVPEEVVAASLEADLLVLGRSGRSPSCRKGLGSTAKNAMLESRKTVMFMRPGFTITGPLLVLYDGTPGSNLALETAISISRQENLMHIIIPSQNGGEANNIEQRAHAILAEKGIHAEYHHVPRTESRRLAQFIRMIDSGLLILSDSMSLSSDTLYSLITEIDYPILLVRQD
jgi:nucleotide-binding universal stress UspA family protein